MNKENKAAAVLAGIFLILRRPKIAAALIAATALTQLVFSFPSLVDVLKSEDGMITAEDRIGRRRWTYRSTISSA